MTPHEQKNMPDDEEHPIARALLVSLQVVAMALCALVICEICWQQALSIPYKMCIDGPASAESVPPITPTP